MKPSSYVLTLAKSAGLTIVELRPTGHSHIRARLRRPDGCEANFFFASTPSEKRGFNNKLSELRRFARNEYNPVTQRLQ